jgi:hypothetical protein
MNERKKSSTVQNMFAVAVAALTVLSSGRVIATQGAGTNQQCSYHACLPSAWFAGTPCCCQGGTFVTWTCTLTVPGGTCDKPPTGTQCL